MVEAFSKKTKKLMVEASCRYNQCYLLICDAAIGKGRACIASVSRDSKGKMVTTWA